MKSRSKREAEELAHREAARAAWQGTRDWIATPGDGYVSVGSLSPVDPEVCRRCSAVIYGRERHDAWHSQIEGRSTP